ncbi:hypothetical protein [uncultured Algoriphagus sp.]|uniref:hypothetical protein n=1 Tax=uncultured Algoriphagus sp. TaxID=417365 RepID=UPI0030EB3916|tara:strand:- start:4303 stop:4611 length:309 start_codon:yes stop_codon:yes gene_type:complete
MLKYFVGYWVMFISVILVFVTLIYLLIYLPSQRISQENLENVKKINHGASQDEVISIMGNKGLEKGVWGPDSVYSYEAGILASSNIEIIFNGKMQVRQIIFP